MTEQAFRDLIRGVRAGEEQAAADLVRLYEPEVRRVLRIELRRSPARRLLESMDVWQSVLLNFFVRAALGQFDLDHPGQVRNLFLIMARNKLRDRTRQARAQFRGGGRAAVSGSEGLADVASPEASPSQVVAHQELLRLLRERLTDAERHLADRRAADCSWAEIAADLGATPGALRMQHDRAINRAARELGLAEVDDV